MLSSNSGVQSEHPWGSRYLLLFVVIIDVNTDGILGRSIFEECCIGIVRMFQDKLCWLEIQLCGGSVHYSHLLLF